MAICISKESPLRKTEIKVVVAEALPSTTEHFRLHFLKPESLGVMGCSF